MRFEQFEQLQRVLQRGHRLFGLIFSAHCQTWQAVKRVDRKRLRVFACGR
jgi:hypothetical protein